MVFYLYFIIEKVYFVICWSVIIYCVYPFVRLQCMFSIVDFLKENASLNAKPTTP
jgi:hypothetical protein